VKVYVTGVAGFIGSHAAWSLRMAGHEVAGCDCLLTGKRENVPAGVEFVEREVQDVDRIEADVVVHMAAIACARWPDQHEVWRQNLGATVYAIWLAREAGARFVFASTAAAERPRSGHYAAAKHAAENNVLLHGGTVLRFANVYGPRQRDWGFEPGVLAAWQRARREGRPLRVDGDGSQTRDFIHVDDVARAVVYATQTDAGDGKILDICTGLQTPIRDLAERFGGETVPGERPPGDPDAIEQDPVPAAELLGFTAQRPLALTAT
jgi:UDP-glucose 4-epimerase